MSPPPIIPSNDSIEKTFQQDENLIFTLILILAKILATILFITSIIISYILYLLLRKPPSGPVHGQGNIQVPKERWLVGPNMNHINPPRIILLSYGTRGDVQPLIALAQVLQLRKCEVILCTTDEFASFANKYGVLFKSCGVSKVEQPSSLQSADSFASVLGVLNDVYGQLSKGMYSAALEFKPDIIISQAVVRGIGAQIAEKLHVSHWSIHFAPSNTPTREFPPGDYLPSRFGTINRLKYFARTISIATAAVKCGLGETDAYFRRNVLGFPDKLDPLVSGRDIERETQIHGYSSWLQPKPKDWPDWIFVVGSFHLIEPQQQHQQQQQRTNSNTSSTGTTTTSPEIESFVNRWGNGNLIYIGFGSMEGTEEFVTTFVKALLLSCAQEDINCGIIVCISTPLSRNRVKKTLLGTTQIVMMTNYNEEHDKLDNRLLFVSDVSHPWLFPKCKLIIHHGGAGTTVAATKALVPQIVVPILFWSDQPFWAGVIQRRGLGICFDRRSMIIQGNQSHHHDNNEVDQNLDFDQVSHVIQTMLIKIQRDEFNQPFQEIKKSIEEDPRNGAEVASDLIMEFWCGSNNNNKKKKKVV
jgi:sterol 3beta-glucosyltransferase